LGLEAVLVLDVAKFGGQIAAVDNLHLFESGQILFFKELQAFRTGLLWEDRHRRRMYPHAQDNLETLGRKSSALGGAVSACGGGAAKPWGETRYTSTNSWSEGCSSAVTMSVKV
jgi:hypothetical protein